MNASARSQTPELRESVGQAALESSPFERVGQCEHPRNVVEERLALLCSNAMILVDPLRLARRQLEIDRDRTARFPHLLAHKANRMMASPFAFLRGSAPLFYELLERHPVLAQGPRGEGWIVGDAHMENFGAYRAGKLTVEESKHSRGEAIVFDLNDFDDAVVGP